MTEAASTLTRTGSEGRVACRQCSIDQRFWCGLGRRIEVRTEHGQALVGALRPPLPARRLCPHSDPDGRFVGWVVGPAGFEPATEGL